MGDPATSTADKRLLFIEDYVLKTLKLKADRWQKCISSEDNKAILHEFLEKADSPVLVVVLNTAGLLCPMLDFPNSIKNKAVYFLKKSGVILSPDSMKRSLIYGDLSYTPLDHLSALVEEVMVPILANQKNHQNWPHVLSQDVLQNVSSLKSNMFVMVGQVRGKTLLPLPSGSEKVEYIDYDSEKINENLDKTIVHAIETAIIQWSHQVRGVLKRESSEQLLQGRNPNPSVELDFWRNRFADLDCIYSQLKTRKVRKMAELLEKMESSYFPAFKALFRDVVAALSEAQDINVFLKPLQRHFEEIENVEFNEVKPLIFPLLHVICLVWVRSKYYNTPTRIIVLMQEVCNLFIQQARTYLNPEDLLKGEMEESLSRVQEVLSTLRFFMQTFVECREKLPTYYKNGEEVKPWDFPSILVFARLEVFLRRLETIEELQVTALDMIKLEKIEFGGVKGKVLSQTVAEMYQEFQDTFKVFSERTYDCLDTENKEFEVDVSEFSLRVQDMDRRLGTVFSLAFDDTSGLEHAFRLLDMFGSLLERPLIARDAFDKYPLLVSMFDQELDDAKAIFDQHMTEETEGYPQINKNMPLVTGNLNWAKELRERLQIPYSNFRHVTHPCMESDGGKRMKVKYEEMMALLDKYVEKLYTEWCHTVSEKSQYNLMRPLITRGDSSKLISVNFDPQLVSVLREVKYLQTLHMETIPKEAEDIFSSKESYRQYTANLELTTTWYNKVISTILEVEFPLVEGQLEDIDVRLKSAEESLNWKANGVWDYIQQVRDSVHDLERRVQKARDNVEEMQAIMKTWVLPIFERKDGKKETLLNLDDRNERLEKRYNIIRDSGNKIHQLLKENMGLFCAEPDSSVWKAYEDYIDEMVLDGFFSAIECSLKFLLDNMDPKVGLAPLFEVQLDLVVPDMVFKPSLDGGASDGLYDIIEGLINDIYRISSLMPRISKTCSFPNYQADMEDMADLADMRNFLMESVQNMMSICADYRNSFDHYAYLYVDDRKEFMRQFLLYSHVLTAEEIEAHAEDGVPETPPTLDQFREQIDSYEKIYEEVSRLEPVNVFESWMKVDAHPFKSALLNVIKRWSLMFKQHLIDHVTNSLSGLEEFIKVAEQGLSKQLKEGDYHGLVERMGHLMAVKDRQSSTDQLFEPLKQTIELLKVYEQELPDEVYKQLEELPEKWNNIKKMALTVKQHVAPLQANEVTLLRRKCASFDVQQHSFREGFRKEAPFRFDSVSPYQMLDNKHTEITKMEATMASIYESAALFEVNVPDYKQLKQCRKEVCLLKELWDMVTLVTSSMDDWQTTRWREINVENMDLECKRFAKDIRNLDKEMRAWDAFTGLDNQVKNILTSLRAVAELQNPAIRERHWSQLMQATGVRFTMDEDTTLADLLKLNLHNFEDEVRGIVDKAVKEMGMEKVLKELDATWSAMNFQYEPHPRTHVPLIKSDEELIETLEDNQVQLQNLMTSKYIAFFLEEVSGWQKKLSTADSVISIWFEVQRTWSHLESIFIGSDDIRAQLPEDSKRFEGIDADFKELANDANGTPNVVEATNKTGLYEKLEDIQARLSLCEKALAEYLDTKRLAFPRFYFISSADLLDILSNGTNPQLVMRHLSKLFDNMAKMKFKDDDLKTGLGMYSKEDEYVTFNELCDCSGQVEIWLNRVLDTMRATVRHEMTEAVTAYEEKPREQWLFDYPAQVALTCTQIWWTTEVGISFARLEEGYENAMKEYYKKQVGQLNTLITMLIGQLSHGERQKIMTICTIDVHARDVVSKMISQKVDNAQAFIWLSQLRHRWDDDKKHCFANICDAQFIYSYEYLGNTPRLVITPLTDRCYITLTQSLHLTMSGAPAGPAGTGKTETTKDLGRALGIMVYVFNCSEQMDYKSCGNIYKGLSQTGAWGCFDEFNRISVEVLSVVAVQVKSIQDAIRDKKKRFNFLGEEINLFPSVGIFITMNPGYAGRTELPENLKALFRPCAMVVPDFELICEIMLVAEGFIEARLLARKFITLYQLCKELLSKQDHYDWGLRAIKSVLVVAGSLKRGDPDRPEDQVLMRALRDFNIPKIVTDDMPVFMGLIGDLFPALDVPRKRDMDFETFVKQAVLDLKLQAEDNFVLKVVQLEELLAVRHSVFIVGNAGTGKSQVLKSLNKTYQIMKRRPVWTDLNPKAVTNDELFGIINPSTREWKDGLFSSIMRELANITHDGPKWIVLDGDIDPMWIESLNTVMDDNKVLTLASNERIPLNPTMRLVFEISHLRTATPATVSRAGILYINPADLGWNPPVTSWIDKREVQSERANLTILFDKYLPLCLDTLRSRFKKIIPIPEQSMVQMLCYLLECLLTKENTPPDCPKELYELYFVFAAVWAFGGAMFQDQLVDYRVEFSKWWVTEFKTIKFPSQGTVFDYYIDPETKKFEPWSKLIPKFEFDPEMPLQACLVHTTETIRVRYFMDKLLEKRRPVMLVGNAGTGKSVLVGEKLSSLEPDEYLIKNVPFNYYTTSAMLLAILEKPLEKKSGRNYGPPGTKKLIYFIDDMNMPEVDTYGTVQPHTLIRQHMDYGHWYDRNKLTMKEIMNVQYVSCMNPTAGSFTINPRLQRHFSVFALSFPGMDALSTIYSTILTQHLKVGNFPTPLQKTSQQLINLALALHQRVTTSFLPTAIKFHYIFNLRDLSNIFQGILFSTPDCLKSPQDLVKLYLHESNRVYRDKMVEEKDFDMFDKIQTEAVKKFYDDIDETLEQVKTLNMFCHFANGVGEPKYMPVQSWQSLNKILVEALDSHNEVNAVMNLVLFEDAMCHICRINRILESPRGNALLVGVGGSGKQSLTRLAAYISSLEVFQITLRKGYGIPDLKADLATQYIKAGVKNVGTVFLMTDAQVADEKFLVLVNDLLASGEIPDLFPDDEVENIISSVRNEVKSQGLLDTRENCWKFFIDRVRRQLKVALCFSPVGNKLRVRSRKFPAVVNCTAIDWFHEWPQEALESVSLRFLQETENIEPSVKDSISKFMAYVHTSVNNMSKSYLSNERRYNYTTPKSFLEQIKLYQNLLTKKSKELAAKMERLENGLEKLNSTSAQVDDLKAKLAAQEVELKQKNEDADKLIQVVGVETEKVGKEKAIADEEEKKVAVIAEEVGRKQRDCETDLAKAEPALIAAQEALNTLNKNNLTELKSFGSPPSAVTNVTAAVMVLTAPGGKIPKDRSWKQARVVMGKVDGFLDSLINFNKENIHENCIKAIQPYLQDPEFNPEFIASKSLAAAGLCSWVVNIVKFYEVYCEVEPKRQALNKANADLAAAEEKLANIKAKIALLNENLAKLTAKFEKATADKLKCQQEADATALTINLANRLSNLTKEQNGFKITLKTLEDNLLSRLSSASGNFLGDIELVENLEITKKTAAEIEEKVIEAKVTEAKLNEAREHYRPAAARASLLYFIMNDLNKIHPMYQFSLKAFSVVFQQAVQRAPADEVLKQRVLNLIDSLTFSVFQYTTRGLFECDKLTFTAQLAFQILLMSKEINTAELDFLLRYPAQPGLTSPVDFLSNQSWGGIKALSTMDEFKSLDRDIEGSAKRWKKFVESECPEKEKFPQEWKNKTALQRLCMMRAIRPDRMTYAVRDFVEEKLGSKYVVGRSLDFATSYEESGPATPMFFILSPGVDPLKDVEKQGRKLGYTFDNRNLHNVSLGQGQEIVAEQALDLAAKEGHWVILQNIHLVAKWLSTLEKKLEHHSEGSHPEFRVFISAEPAGSPDGHIIPQGILENSIKITNEPPTGMHANLHKALDNFTQDTLEMCARETEFKSILFALCYFHAVVAERRKFGPQGWNRSYPFNTGDLTISVNVLYNYLEANAKVPYDDLRYLFGEIMYGGHITDDWDRRLCRTYLEEFIKPEMLEGELFLAPGFPLPGNMDYNGYHQYIDDALPAESPYLYGLHPNAEIGFLTQTSEKLFRTVLEMQPRDSSMGDGGGVTREEKVKATLDEILEKLPEEFNILELMGKVEERTPYIVVAFQECERMNMLTSEIKRSLKELNLGLKGELTMTSDMENLQNAIYLDQVPESWTKRAYPSMAGLAGWFVDLLSRIKELETWTSDFALPSAVWLAGFFNPQSFLTAIMQSMARKNEWPLDKMTLQCDVTKKNREDFSSPPREGAYVHGLFMEGARWDTQTGIITDARLKDLTPAMPVIFIKAIPVDKQDTRNVYACPVYKTRQRGPTYVWTFNLKTKENPSKWVLAGVALLLQI
ncbi:dynein axonemal heavy chain 9 isoform X2 [Hyperolius riggenbachi]|uniref:dynein axonemal heavy chain 9 isoform X2 n=1 Tax=Hyperolius riggenbachi TaxID=752182 RepID=UPI0035A3C49A